jgi:CHAT domain-containing protein
MARTRHLRFRVHQPLGKHFRLGHGRLTRLGWLTHLVFVCLTVLLCIISQPVFAYLSGEVAVTQSLPTASQLLQQGREHYEAGQYAPALKIWQQAAQAYQSQGDRINQAMVLSNLALANQQLGQLSEAEEAIASSLKLLQSEPDTKEGPRILAQALNTQGSLQMAQGQAQQALTTLQQATDAYKQVGDEAGVVRSLLNQAQALRVLGFYSRALSTLTQVNQTLQTQPNSLLKASGLRHLGNTRRLIGNLDESRTVLQQSLEIAEELPSPPDIAAALLGLGNTARAQQNPKAAIDFYQQAAAIEGSPTIRIQALVNQLSLIAEGGVKGNVTSLVPTLLPQIQTQLADLPLSRISIYARINIARSLIQLGTRHWELGSGERNTETQGYGDMGNSSDTSSTSSRQPISDLREIAKILATAIQQAKTLGDQQAQAYALGSLGGLYEKTQQWSQAQDLTQQALILTQSINAPDIAYRWQWQLGRLLQAKGDEKAAIAAYTEAVNTLQSLRNDLVAINSDVQFSFRESVEPVYRELVSLLLKSDGTKISPHQIEQARKVIESLQLAELDNFFRAACLNAQPVQIDAIDRKAAVIYPIILPDRLEVILSLPQQPIRHYATSLPQDRVERLVKQLRQDLTKQISRQFLPLSQQVYNWLIQPIETDLQANDIKTLVFVLDGSLRNIPMAALYDGKQYLIEKYAVALTPGLELLEPQPLAKSQLKILTAGLSEARQGFNALPGVEAELKQIHSQLPSEVLLNQEFTKTGIQNKIDAVPFPVVHLATHGQFSSQAEDTFILTWDDRINVSELNSLLRTTDLHGSSPIELLVLSACQTALGDNRAALGIAGVAVRAGARSTLATLWAVNDEATAALMVRFYQELANSTVTKAEALRRAQQFILKDPRYRQHPYYWAPYVLVGNWL